MPTKPRTKGGLKPASSVQAQDLLLKSGNKTSGFIGFSSSELDHEDLDSELLLVFKKLQKKDVNTKIKSLQELDELVGLKECEVISASFSTWCRMYSKLAFDDDQRIRKQTHEVLLHLIEKVKKAFAPYLKNVIGQWVFVMGDPIPSVQSAAVSAFEKTFSANKQSEIFAFCNSTIQEFIEDYMFNRTTENISNNSSDGLEVRQIRLSRLVGCSLNALSTVLCKTSPEKRTEYLEFCRKHVINNTTFWNILKNASSSFVVNAHLNCVINIFQLMENMFNHSCQKTAFKILVNKCFEYENFPPYPRAWECLNILLSLYKDLLASVEFLNIIFPKLKFLLNNPKTGNNSLVFHHFTLLFAETAKHHQDHSVKLLYKFSYELEESPFPMMHSELSPIILSYMECFYHSALKLPSNSSELHSRFQALGSLVKNSISQSDLQYHSVGIFSLFGSLVIELLMRNVQCITEHTLSMLDDILCSFSSDDINKVIVPRIELFFNEFASRELSFLDKKSSEKKDFPQSLEHLLNKFQISIFNDLLTSCNPEKCHIFLACFNAFGSVKVIEDVVHSESNIQLHFVRELLEFCTHDFSNKQLLSSVIYQSLTFGRDIPTSVTDFSNLILLLDNELFGLLVLKFIVSDGSSFQYFHENWFYSHILNELEDNTSTVFLEMLRLFISQNKEIAAETLLRFSEILLTQFEKPHPCNDVISSVLSQINGTITNDGILLQQMIKIFDISCDGKFQEVLLAGITQLAQISDENQLTSFLKHLFTSYLNKRITVDMLRSLFGNFVVSESAQNLFIAAVLKCCTSVCDELLEKNCDNFLWNVCFNDQSSFLLQRSMCSNWFSPTVKSYVDGVSGVFEILKIFFAPNKFHFPPTDTSLFFHSQLLKALSSAEGKEVQSAHLIPSNENIKYIEEWICRYKIVLPILSTFNNLIDPEFKRLLWSVLKQQPDRLLKTLGFSFANTSEKASFTKSFNLTFWNSNYSLSFSDINELICLCKCLEDAEVADCEIVIKSFEFITKANFDNHLINCCLIDCAETDLQLTTSVISLLSLCLSSRHFDATNFNALNFDYLLCALVGWFSSCCQTSISHLISDFSTQLFVYRLFQLFSTLIDLFKSTHPQAFPNSNIVNEWKDFFSPQPFKFCFDFFKVISETLDSSTLHLSPFITESCCMVIVSMTPSDLKRMEMQICLKNDEDSFFSDEMSSFLNHIMPSFSSHSLIIQLAAFNILHTYSPQMVQSVDFSKDIKNLPSSLNDLIISTSTVVSHAIENTPIGTQCFIDDAKTHQIFCQYLLLWRTVFKFACDFSPEDKYVLTEIITSGANHLLHILIRLISPDQCSTLIKSDFALEFRSSPAKCNYSTFIQNLSIHTYLDALRVFPTLVRDWWDSQSRDVKNYVESFTSKHLSPLLCKEELSKLKDSQKKYANMEIKVFQNRMEVESVYSVDEMKIELIVRLPENYPLGKIAVVDCQQKRLGVEANVWRSWMLELTKFLQFQNGAVIDGMLLWKRNLDKKFEGVEECVICFAILHFGNRSLPRLTCKTCKKKYHNICLYKWFESSSNSLCPHCRNLF